MNARLDLRLVSPHLIIVVSNMPAVNLLSEILNNNKPALSPYPVYPYLFFWLSSQCWSMKLPNTYIWALLKWKAKWFPCRVVLGVFNMLLPCLVAITLSVVTAEPQPEPMWVFLNFLFFSTSIILNWKWLLLQTKPEVVLCVVNNLHLGDNHSLLHHKLERTGGLWEEEEESRSCRHHGQRRLWNGHRRID